MREPTSPNNRGRESWVVNLVEFIKGDGPLPFNPEPLFDKLAQIEMAYCVGPRLVLPTLVRPQPNEEIQHVRFGQFSVMMSLN